MHFDWTITFGQVAQIVTTIAACLTLFSKVGALAVKFISSFDLMGYRVGSLETTLNKAIDSLDKLDTRVTIVESKK